MARTTSRRQAVCGPSARRKVVWGIWETPSSGCRMAIVFMNFEDFPERKMRVSSNDDGTEADAKADDCCGKAGPQPEQSGALGGD